MRFGVRELVFVLLLLGMPVAAFFFVFQPRNQQIAEARDEIVKKQSKLQQLEAATSAMSDLGEEIESWARPLFAQEQEAERRTRLAACHLSDIGWRYHPDYRAEQTLLRVLRAQELYVEHPDRAFLGLALYYRYGGDKGKKPLKGPLSLLSSSRAKDAEVLGRALRLAYLLSGGAPEMLRRSRLEPKGKKLTLHVPDQAPIPTGATIQKRLKSLAASMKLEKAEVVLHTDC